jgi:hypothetical protein
MHARDREEAFQIYLAILRSKLEATGIEEPLPTGVEELDKRLRQYARIARRVQDNFNFVIESAPTEKTKVRRQAKSFDKCQGIGGICVRMRGHNGCCTDDAEVAGK